MHPVLALLSAFLKADLRKAHLAALSGPVPVSAAVAILMLASLAAGLIPSFMIMMIRAVNPLVFDSYLLLVFIICLWLFPTGLVPEEERDFMLFMRVGAPVRRRLEFMHVISFGLPLTSALAAPALIANYIIGAEIEDTFLLYLLLATSGLIVMLAVGSIQKLRVIRTQGWAAWTLNSFVAVCIILLLSELTPQLAQTPPEPGMAFGPGAALSRIYGLLSGKLAGIAAGALASAFLLFMSAAISWRLGGQRGDSELGCVFAARQSAASRCVLACNARAGNRSWLGFVSSVLALYILRARRLNGILTILLAYVFWTAVGPSSASADTGLGPGMTTIAFSLSAFIYASIAFSQDGCSRFPVHLHGTKLQRLAFATLIFSTLLTALIAAIPLFFLLMRGSPWSVVLMGSAWVLVAAYVSHLIMALIRPHLPLSEPMGTFSAIVIVIRCILVCQVASLGVLYILFRLSEALRTGWPLIGSYAAIAIPLTFAFVRTLARRLRYQIPVESAQASYRPISEAAGDCGRGGDQG